MAKRGTRSKRPKTRDLVSEQPPWEQPRMRFDPLRAVSDDELEAIHHASLRVLRETGIDFLDETARSQLAAAGAQVTGERVRFDPELVESLVATAPTEFILHGREPHRDLKFGGDHLIYTSVASPPFVTGLGQGRRDGNRIDYRNLIKMGQVLNAIHTVAGYPVEPMDIHPSIRHLEATHDMLTLSDKTPFVYSLGRQRNLDAIEMVRIVRGVDTDTLDKETSIYSVINASTPLRYDTVMLHGIQEMSARNQLIIITPFTLAGAMAPVTIAGAVVLQNAEALAGIAYTQVVRPGSPVAYGGFTSNVDMRSGSPAFGTPEYWKACLLGGQLARRYRLPYRSSNVNASNSVDAQSAYESVIAIWGAVMGGVNLLLHGAGWLEGGLLTSYEKFVIDADLLNMVTEMLRPITVDDASLAVEAIAEVGPAGHFFGSTHTQERYASEHFQPMVSAWRNYESWDESGRLEAHQRAERLAHEIIAAHEEPPMLEDRRVELDEFVARRVQEGGVETDF
ncbi:MAG: trimethylamine methyltransferase family protein [Actinomycetota bacterium]|nr:trimethylamine methyltransferase family protein [Actinomycetota bacterium]MEE2807300.1 trimethylamine methyltransferase family protein [Actinomycetota bacterium]